MRLYCLLALTLKLKLPCVISKKLVYCNSFTSRAGVLKRNFALFNTANCQQWGKNKQHRNIKLKLYFDSMADPQIEEALAPLRASVKEQVILG